MQVISIGFMVLQMILIMGILRITLMYVDGEQPESGDLFACRHLLGKYFVGRVIFVLIVILGFLMLIIPGVIIALKFQFYDYLIIDREMEPAEAIKLSGKMTDGIVPDLFVFALALIAINVVGALFLGIGLLFSMPVSLVAMAHVYRQLQPRHAAGPA